MPSNLIHFDLDGVLWDPHEFLKYTLPHCVNRGIEKGLKGKPDDILKEIHEVRKEYGSNYGGHFDVLVERMNGKNDPGIVNAMQNVYHACKADYMKPIPFVENALRFCRNAGYILTIASNGNDDKQEEKLYDLNLMPYFEFSTSEHSSKRLFAIGNGDTAKPSPYTWTILRHEVSEYFGNSNIEVHVGDKLNADVIGANSLGIISVYARFGPHGKETIDSVIEKDSRDPKALRALIEPDYVIDDMRQIPSTMNRIVKDYPNLNAKKAYQVEIASDLN